MVAESLLRNFYRFVGCPPVRFVLRCGGDVLLPGLQPVGAVVFADAKTLIRLFFDPVLAFGEGYTDGRIEVHGDLAEVLTAVAQSMAKAYHGTWYSRLLSLWQDWTQNNTLSGSRQNIHRHYDLRTDFYQLWLDHQLLYTCAYFPQVQVQPDMSLEAAQIAKMEHVCRKVCLQPGETVVEAGCGWGALAIYMAQNYGVHVKAFNVSHEQIIYARQRAWREGVANRVEFIEDDYRNVSGKFDAFVSVGMLEHVGKDHYPELGRVIHRCIGASGRGLLHFIGRNRPRPFNTWTRKYIFPGTYAPSIREAIGVLEPWDYAVLDVENLRPHYAKTLEHWLERFERSEERITEMFGARFVTMWRLYLASSIAGFRSGSIQLFQITFAGQQWRQIPWTRADIYRDESAIPQREEARWTRARQRQMS